MPEDEQTTENTHTPDCPVWVPQGATPHSERERCTATGPHDIHRAREPRPAGPVQVERVRRALGLCPDCGERFKPVRRGECSHCGSDAGAVVTPPGEST